MKAKAEATIEDLYRVPDNAKAEIVEGEIVLMPPSGPEHGRTAFRVAASLYAYEQSTNSGHMAPDNVGFVVNLPHRKSFSPDVAFYQGAVSLKFVNGAPLFAIEVRSEHDYGPAAEREMAAKRADYFAAGTQVVWDVDLLGEDVVRAYRASDPDTPTVYRRGDIADAEPALPGWRIAVNSILE